MQKLDAAFDGEPLAGQVIDGSVAGCRVGDIAGACLGRCEQLPDIAESCAGIRNQQQRVSWETIVMGTRSLSGSNVIGGNNEGMVTKSPGDSRSV